MIKNLQSKIVPLVAYPLKDKTDGKNIDTKGENGGDELDCMQTVSILEDSRNQIKANPPLDRRRRNGPSKESSRSSS